MHANRLGPNVPFYEDIIDDIGDPDGTWVDLRRRCGGRGPYGSIHALSSPCPLRRRLTFASLDRADIVLGSGPDGRPRFVQRGHRTVEEIERGPKLTAMLALVRVLNPERMAEPGSPEQIHSRTETAFSKPQPSILLAVAPPPSAPNKIRLVNRFDSM